MLRKAIIAIAITVGACATGSTYKVHDENGWPIGDWEARHSEGLAFTCRGMPGARYLTEGERRFVVLDHELSTALYRKFCAQPTPAVQLVVLTLEHRQAL